MEEDRIVREAECRKITGLCRTTRFLMEREGKFPARVRISARAVGWKLSDLQEWTKNAKPVTGKLASQNIKMESHSGKIVEVDKELFKQLLQFVLNLPELGSQLAAVNVDTGPTATGEVLISLEPSEFLLRLNAALRACG
ncbi:TPA: helix-turn-helix transcriptional regulator [Serratia fonticola]